MTTTATTWSEIVVAALGSSALGAIVGGYVTTRVRGRIERDEAWRTRLVEASDEFLIQLDRAVSAMPYNWLVAVGNDEESLRIDGRLTPDAARAIGAFNEERAKLLLLVARIELLFASEAVDPAKRAVRNVDNVAAILARARWIEDEISQHGAEHLEIAIDASLDADEFDPEADASVALWTRVLLESAAEHRDQFVAACTSVINSDRPSQAIARRR